MTEPPPLVQLSTFSADETEALARSLAHTITPGSLIGLKGDLGAGKTCFTRGFVSGLEHADRAQVSSPTFALLNVYDTEPPVYHFDFYRLSDLDDLETTGYWDILRQGTGVIIVEWCDRVREAIDDHALVIEISMGDEGDDHRVLTYTGRRDLFGDLVTQ